MSLRNRLVNWLSPRWRPLGWRPLVVAIMAATGMAAHASEGDGKPRQLISSGSKWETLAAYSRAVVDGDWIFVSGTVGFDPRDGSIPKDFDAQMDNIFHTIDKALTSANASLHDIVRVRCYLVDARYVEPMSRKLHQYLAKVRPANTTVIVDLAVKGALIEVEVTALRRHQAGG